MKRGSIDLARRLCYEIAGPTDEEDDMSGSDYGSVDIAEILSAEVEMLRAAICQTLDANSHLADGDVCTLFALKLALRESGAPWEGDMEDLNKCPRCGCEADNGHDRCYPPTAYLCSKCSELHNAKVSGAGTASAGLPGYAGDNNGARG